jgi:hypothetical protein
MKRILILMNLMLFAATSAHAQVTQQWVARYHDGPATGHCAARAIVLDPSGNVYVAGESSYVDGGLPQYFVVTAAYNPDGNQLWAARYPVSGVGR